MKKTKTFRNGVFWVHPACTQTLCDILGTNHLNQRQEVFESKADGALVDRIIGSKRMLMGRGGIIYSNNRRVMQQIYPDEKEVFLLPPEKRLIFKGATYLHPYFFMSPYGESPFTIVGGELNCSEHQDTFSVNENNFITSVYNFCFGVYPDCKPFLYVDIQSRPRQKVS
jgi:hypothetical protein